MAKNLVLSPVVVECPLCGDVVPIPDYPSITRSDALAGHIVTKHASRVLPMPPTEGPPLPRALGVRWPWKK